MTKIILSTSINAPIQIVFDCARSIDIHQLSTAKTNEKAIVGRITGLCELGDEVTWRAKHFGIWLELTSKITEARRPEYFVDEMQKGTFKSLRHEHHFIKTDDGILMKDIFIFESPFGILGKIANYLVLKNYLKGFLIERNQFIKEMAESGRW